MPSLLDVGISCLLYPLFLSACSFLSAFKHAQNSTILNRTPTLDLAPVLIATLTRLHPHPQAGLWLRPSLLYLTSVIASMGHMPPAGLLDVSRSTKSPAHRPGSEPCLLLYPNSFHVFQDISHAQIPFSCFASHKSILNFVTGMIPQIRLTPLHLLRTSLAPQASGHNLTPSVV